MFESAIILASIRMLNAKSVWLDIFLQVDAIQLTGKDVIFFLLQQMI